jgi:NitT/TauT family transport system permease protein
MEVTDMNAKEDITKKLKKEDRWILVYQIIFFFCVIAVWQISVETNMVSRVLLATPSSILLTIIEQHELYLTHLKFTISVIAVGFFCGTCLATVLALVIVYSRILSRLLNPYIVALNSTAKVALAPLILLIFGFGVLPGVVIVVLVSFLPLMNNLVIGLKSTKQEHLELLEIYGASKWQVFKRARLPAALPYIFSGLKTSVVFSVKGAVIGEVFQSYPRGLGELIIVGDYHFDPPLVYGASLITCSIGIVSFLLISKLEDKLLYWHESRIETLR